jgi:hypothetical protein
MTGKNNVEHNKQLSSDLGIRYVFHGTEFMKLTDCQGNHMEINPTELSIKQKKIVGISGKILSSL